MKPDPSVGPGPDEEGSGLPHGQSRKWMENEEMRWDEDTERDLTRTGQNIFVIS